MHSLASPPCLTASGGWWYSSGGTHLALTPGFHRDAPMRPHLPAALSAENIYIQIRPSVPCFCLKPARASVLATWEARCDFISGSSTKPRVNKNPGLAGRHPPCKALCPGAFAPAPGIAPSCFPASMCSSHGSHGPSGSCHLPKKPFLSNTMSCLSGHSPSHFLCSHLVSCYFINCLFSCLP